MRTLTGRAARAAASFGLSLVLLAGGCGGDSGALDALLAQAEAAAARGDVDAAREALADAERLVPESTAVKLRWARLEERAGAREEALALYQAAQQLAPALPEAQLGEARLLADADPERARELARGVLAASPQSAAAHVALARIAAAQGETERARTLARQAVALDPADPLAYLELASIAPGPGAAAAPDAESEAAAAPDEAAVPDPLAERSDALARAERLYAERGDLWGAVSAARRHARLLAGAPGHAGEAAAVARRAVERAEAADARPLVLAAGRDAAAIAARTGDTDLRRWALERLTQVDEAGLEPWIELAALEESLEPGASAAVLERLLVTHSDEPNAHVVYAGYLQRDGGPEAAIAHLESVAADVVDPVPVLVLLARLHGEVDDDAAADAVVEQLARAHAERPAVRLLRAEQAIARGEPQETVRLLALAGPPLEGREPRRLLARALLELGELRAAFDVIETGLDEGGFDAGLLRLRAAVLARGGRWPAVLRTLRSLHDAGERFEPEDRLLRAAAFYEVGERERGREIIERELQRQPPAGEVVALFVRYEREAAPERARRLLAAALERDPDDPALRGARQALEGAGDGPAAVGAGPG